jgi:hypothetical protein
MEKSMVILCAMVLVFGLSGMANGKFEEIQAIPTNGAHDWKNFTIDGETYFAVTNVYNGSTYYNIDSKVYRWGGTSFIETQADNFFLTNHLLLNNIQYF